MRVIMLSWEYPPRIVGGIARHVEELSWALARRGAEVHVVTAAAQDAPADEVIGGVHVHRVHAYSPASDFVHWVQQLNAAMADRSSAILGGALHGAPPKHIEGGVLLHAHDWLGHYAGAALKHRYRVPLVATIHATESGRNNGLHTDAQRYIASVERDLTHESWRVIACSDFMRSEVERVLDTPADKIDVVPNGIDAGKFSFGFGPDETTAFRSRFAAPDEKLVFFVGRMVHEKGAHVLVEALRILRERGHQAKLVIVGGGHRQHLEDQAASLGLSGQVYFTGFVSDADLLRLYRVIDVACYPSLYEPFGIVALEAMAAGVPVVVSDVGGLREVVHHDRTGTLVWPGNPESLAWGIERVLTDRGHVEWMASNASRHVREHFNWDRIAEQTDGIHQRVWEEYQRCEW